MSEEKNNVSGGCLMQVSQQFIYAKPEDNCQSWVVWVHQDNDAIDVLEVSYFGNDIVKILFILLNSSEKQQNDKYVYT